MCYYSDHDALSNCFNRRTFNEALEQLARSRDSGKRCTFLLIDIDHFKGINDEHGHLVATASSRRSRPSLDARSIPERRCSGMAAKNSPLSWTMLPTKRLRIGRAATAGHSFLQFPGCRRDHQHRRCRMAQLAIKRQCRTRSGRPRPVRGKERRAQSRHGGIDNYLIAF